MLRSVREFEGYKVGANDGDVGGVRDFYFDDECWAIRYLVVDAYFTGLRVLVSPIAFRHADWATRHFDIDLTREKVVNSPGIDLEQPITRRYEREYFRYFGWPCYWGGGEGGIWGGEASPGLLGSRAWSGLNDPEDQEDNPHLRSVREVIGYHIQGTDGEIGHVDDFIVDDETWAIRYLVIDTGNWWTDRKVLVAPHWAEDIRWADNIVALDLTREAIRESPEWHADAGVNREYEERLYDYYGRPAYWTAED